MPGKNPDPPKKERKPTEYVVLRQIGGGTRGGEEEGAEVVTIPDQYEVLATVTAQSEALAKKKYAEERTGGDFAGEFDEMLVAAPLRSWHPKRHHIVRQPKLIVE